MGSAKYRSDKAFELFKMKRLESDLDQKHEDEHSSLFYDFKKRNMSQSDVFLRAYAELEIKHLREFIKLRIQAILESIEIGKQIEYVRIYIRNW